MQLLGIDIGGSGIKGAIVDAAAGQLVSDRYRIDTPAGALPQAVAEVVAQLAKHFSWKGAIGCTFPAIVHHGVTLSAANVDQSWIGTDAKKLFEKSTGLPVQIINDADAAGIAEIEFGAGRGRNGLVIMLTFGTGIGSAMFLKTRAEIVPAQFFNDAGIIGAAMSAKGLVVPAASQPAEVKAAESQPAEAKPEEAAAVTAPAKPKAAPRTRRAAATTKPATTP